MKKRKTPTLVTSAVLTLITIFFWAGFEVYRSLTIKPEPSVPPAILNPLNPNLDVDSLNNIQQRLYFDDSQIGSTSATITPVVAPTASPLASATPIPVIPTGTPSASPTP